MVYTDSPDGCRPEATPLDQIAETLELIDAVGDMFAALDEALAEITLPRLRASHPAA